MGVRWVLTVPAADVIGCHIRLPVLFLGFYTSTELARLILLLKTMSSLRTILIDQGVHLARVLLSLAL